MSSINSPIPSPCSTNCEFNQCNVSRLDSGFSDVSDLLPPTTFTGDITVPDSVLLLSLEQTAISPISNYSDCVFVNTPHKQLADPDNANHRVQFTEEEIQIEHDTIETLHSTICRNSLTVPRLFAAVIKDNNKTLPFFTDGGLETYIKNRSFVFSLSNIVQNRGFGYRTNFIHIVRYIDSKMEDGGCSIDDLVENVINRLPIYNADDLESPWNDSWFTEQRMDKKSVIDFLSNEHAELFNLENDKASNAEHNIIVRLTSVAYSVACLWNECFPPMPTTLLWDESRVYSFITSISYVHEHHAIATIQTSVFRGRLVYIHRSRVGPPDLRRALSVGSMISVTAHMTWNTTAQFRALKVVSNFSNFEVRKVRTPTEELSRSPRKDIRSGYVYRSLLRRAADSEKQMVKFADELFAETMYSRDGLQRRLFKYKSGHRDSPFANFQELELFLMERPHLYVFDEMGARRASNEEREIARAFIQLISEFGFSGVSKHELRTKLVNSNYPLKIVVVQKSLDEYIQQISPLLEVVHLVNPVEDVVMLRGTYIPEENLFVHHFKPGFVFHD